MEKSDLLKQLGEDLNPRQIEIDEISEKYGFPVAFIMMYDIRLSGNGDNIFITDGSSFTSVNMSKTKLMESDTDWTFREKETNLWSISLEKATRKIITIIP